jgi:hypothetical protein
MTLHLVTALVVICGFAGTIPVQATATPGPTRWHARRRHDAGRQNRKTLRATSEYRALRCEIRRPIGSTESRSRVALSDVATGWGQVLGTRAGVLRASRGASRRSSKRTAKARRSRKNKAGSATPSTRRRTGSTVRVRQRASRNSFIQAPFANSRLHGEFGAAHFGNNLETAHSWYSAAPKRGYPACSSSADAYGWAAATASCCRLRTQSRKPPCS